MTRFLRKGFLFLLPVFILIITGETMLRNIPNNYSFKREYLDANSNSLKVLFLGNSHVYNGINPSLLPYAAFNASNPAQTLRFDYALLKKYNDSLEKLKCIVLSVDYSSVYVDLLAGSERFRETNYSIYYGMDFDLPLEKKFEITNRSLKNNIHRLKNYYLEDSSEVACNKSGWGNQIELSTKNISILSYEAAKRHTATFIDSSLLRTNAAILDSFIAFASQRGIKIILFSAPVYKEYELHLNKAQWEGTQKLITEKVKQYPGAHYYDLLASTAFDIEDFGNGDHLNVKGAIKLTKIMDSLVSMNIVWLQ